MNRGTRGLLVAALIGAAALVTPAKTDAGTFSTTLDTLLAGGNNAGGITLGDKRYSNFTFSTDDETLLPRAVSVTLSNDDAGNRYQLRFGFNSLFANEEQEKDVVICYQVDVLGNQLINGVGLEFTSQRTGGTGGDAAASVIETVSSIDPDGAGPLEAPPVVAGNPDSTVIIDVFNDGPGGLPDETSATLAVLPTRSLLFCKDILVSSRDGGGTVNITTVDNIVNQIPEPTSLGLFAAGAASLLLRRRRS